MSANNKKIARSSNLSALFQYSSVLFDNRIKLNSDLKAIVEMTPSNISPQLHAKLLNCQTTSCTSFQQIAEQLHAHVPACYANCWEKIAISTYMLFGNI